MKNKPILLSLLMLMLLSTSFASAQFPDSKEKSTIDNFSGSAVNEPELNRLPDSKPVQEPKASTRAQALPIKMMVIFSVVIILIIGAVIYIRQKRVVIKAYKGDIGIK